MDNLCFHKQNELEEEGLHGDDVVLAFVCAGIPFLFGVFLLLTGRPSLKQRIEYRKKLQALEKELNHDDGKTP